MGSYWSQPASSPQVQQTGCQQPGGPGHCNGQCGGCGSPGPLLPAAPPLANPNGLSLTSSNSIVSVYLTQPGSTTQDAAPVVQRGQTGCQNERGPGHCRAEDLCDGCKSSVQGSPLVANLACSKFPACQTCNSCKRVTDRSISQAE